MNAPGAPLRILVVDDEPLARERALHLLAKIDGVEVVGQAADGNEALELIESQQPDVLLLDVQMPGLDGVRLLEALDDPPAVIFSTAFDKYAVQAFNLEAVDYLLKPYSAERLTRALDRVRRLLSGGAPRPEERDSKATVPAQLGLSTQLVPVERIVLFQIEEEVVFLLRDDREKLICDLSLREIETSLTAESFFRVSRQAIINLGAVESLTPTAEGGYRLTLKTGAEATVSRRRARHLRARLNLS